MQTTVIEQQQNNLKKKIPQNLVWVCPTKTKNLLAYSLYQSLQLPHYSEECVTRDHHRMIGGSHNLGKHTVFIIFCPFDSIIFTTFSFLFENPFISLGFDVAFLRIILIMPLQLSHFFLLFITLCRVPLSHQHFSTLDHVHGSYI